MLAASTAGKHVNPVHAVPRPVLLAVRNFAEHMLFLYKSVRLVQIFFLAFEILLGVACAVQNN